MHLVLLIIEDEEAVAEMYATYFKENGFDVEVSNNGSEGFEKMVAKRPALVLMDIVMQGISGDEVVEKAMQDPATKDIPIIMLTNFTDSIQLKNAMRMGAKDFIVKTELTPKQVVERVQKYIKPPNADSANKHKYLGS